MNRFISFLFSAALLFTVASCDEHEPVDLAIYPGHVLLSDGRIVPAESVTDGQRPVAVVFAPQTDKYPILAVLMDEIGPLAFCDTLGMEQKTSCDVTAYDGYVNTVAMQTTYKARDTLTVKDNKADPSNYYSSPLANYAFRSHWFFQSDYIPSVAELGLLYVALPTVNPVLQRFGGTPVSMSPEDAGCWYWTSTEVEQNQPNQAWLFSMADGSRHKAAKTNAYRARLIVEYNPLGSK